MNFRFWKHPDGKSAPSDRRDAAFREKSIAALLSDARGARSATDAYWRRMRAYYDGTHDTAKQTGEFCASLDLPWRPASVPDGYLHVESQIEATPPDFEFSARGDGDETKAKVRERVVRYAVQNSDLTAKNAVNERRLGICGSAVWKLAVGRGEDGEPEVAIENPPPETIYPDPAATSVDDCEYIACVYRMSAARAARLFAADLRRLGLSMTDVLRGRDKPSGRRLCAALPDDMPRTDETVEITEWWFRQPEDGEAICGLCGDDGEEQVAYRYRSGDIALSVLIEGTEIRYVPKFWTKTSCRWYPIVIYGKIPQEGTVWGKSELETVIPLIDAADRQLVFAQLNTAFLSNDILVYEENAFSPDSYPENRPGAIWKLRPGMMDKVKRLGGLAGESISHYEIVDRYRAMMKEALGNYDFMQGDSSTQVTTATGLALLGDYASRRMQAKNICKRTGFERLYRLIDMMALELFDTEKVRAITDGAGGYSYEGYLGTLGYVPSLDIAVHVGEGVENSRSFTLSALSELVGCELAPENYPVVRAYINALGIPERASLITALDKKFLTESEEFKHE